MPSGTRPSSPTSCAGPDVPAGLHVVDPGLSPVASVVAVLLVTTATLVVGAFGLRLSRTTSDFYVAGRAVTPGWNASAISGEYLSAASFLGVAGLVLTAGTDMLWFPVGYTAGYLVLLVLVAAPLRRSGAYTLPDFAEARLESARVRSAASLLVVGIGWLYLIPQLQGAGPAFAFVVPAGFAGFDTPVGFLRFNRAVLARVAVYQHDWTGALTALQASYLD